MPVETTYTIKADCDGDDCFTSEVKAIRGDWFCDNVDETDIQDFLMQLDIDGWEVFRASYEEIKTYCPKCKAKREG